MIEIHVLIVVVGVLCLGLVTVLVWAHGRVERQVLRNMDELRRLRERDCEDLTPDPSPHRRGEKGETNAKYRL